MNVLLYVCQKCRHKRIYGGGCTPEYLRPVMLQCEGECRAVTEHIFHNSDYRGWENH